MLKIEKLSISYEEQKIILHDLDLEIRRGEVTALIGPNGIGKSTLIRGITGIIPPRCGKITYDGENLTEMDPRTRAHLISVVPQVNTLPPGYTVYETVSHGRTPYLNWYGKLSKADRDIIDESIRLTELEAYTDKEVSTLSGGEQQRVVLARALAQDAPVMILDEPTAFLDLHYQISLLELERRIVREKNLAVLLIIHDLNLAARYADKITILSGGTIAHCGTPEEVLKEEILSEIYHTPIRVLKNEKEGLIVLPEKLSKADS